MNASLGTNYQLGGNELSSSLYTAVYVEPNTSNHASNTTSIRLQGAAWASYASGGSTRTWNGYIAHASSVRNSYSTTAAAACVEFGGTYSNYTSPVWVINKSCNYAHDGNGYCTLYGAKFDTNTQNNGVIGHEHKGYAGTSDNSLVLPRLGYTISFHANGGSSTPSSIHKIGTANITLPSAISRSGYTFAGWNTNSSGTGTNYSAGQSYGVNGSTTLYAKWVPANGVYIYDGSSWRFTIPYVYDGSNWRQTVPYVYNGSSWKNATK